MDSRKKCVTHWKDNSFLPILDITIKKIRKVCGGALAAAIASPVKVAGKLIIVSKGRIRRVMCRIREHVMSSWYFRRLDFSEFIATCTSVHNRSEAYWKCGEQRYFIKDYTGSPRCMLCKEKGDVENRHVTNGSRYQVFGRQPNRTRLIRLCSHKPLEYIRTLSKLQ